MATVSRSTTITSVFIGVCAFLLCSLPGIAKEFDRGQALYENHCGSCHDKTVHKREERRATSLHDLHKWVMTWSFHAELGWSGEEIDDVVDFLNRRYYQFTDKP